MIIALAPAIFEGTVTIAKLAEGMKLVMGAVEIAGTAKSLTNIGKNLYEVHQTKKEQELLRKEDALKAAAIAAGVGIAGYAGKKLIDKLKNASEKASDKISEENEKWSA